MESYLHGQIHDRLLRAAHPVFISDERIDGDSLGASLAMADFLAQHGKEVQVFVSGPIPEQYTGLPGIHRCTDDTSIFQTDEIDLVVVFDCSDGEYVRGLLEHIPTQPTVINIDHHDTNPRYGHLNQVCVDAPATAEVVYRFFEHNKLVMSRDAATCLLAGLCFDTGALSNGATNERALETASQLLLQGARVHDVIQAMFQNRSINALRVWGAALERLHLDESDQMVATYLTRKDIEDNQVTDDEIDGLSNFISLVIDADSLKVLRETKEGNVKVSMRSSVQHVGDIAKQNGGGGHKAAAGYTIPESKIICDETGCWRVVKSA